ADGKTRITGEIHSRDHTERLLSHFGVNIKSSPTDVLVEGGQKFKANKLKVPSDPSTAAFWLAGASLVKGSELLLKNVSLNPTRIGFIRVLERMGGKVTMKMTEKDPEPIGDITCGYAGLKGITIEEAEVPSLIDELPVLSVLASQAQGRTVVTGAEELRVKETDRIEALATNLRAMGIQIETTPDGFIIEGPQKLKGAKIDSFHDHRIAMAFSIAGLVAEGETIIENADCVGISYPEFFTTLQKLTS
ncbi:MAG: 3-phosphoshikimate 1-carboxyvinyltransferase, partial [Bdellovibrionota bacterium]